MNNRILYIICTFLLLSACVKAPVFKADGHALIRSNYPIVRVNGTEVGRTYRLDIEAGENTLVIVYNTYQHDYFCTFNWVAAENTVYEVTDQDNRYPLTLYRWVNTNSLWASRLDYLDPEACIRKPRRRNNNDNKSALLINNINNVARMK